MQNKIKESLNEQFIGLCNDMNHHLEGKKIAEKFKTTSHNGLLSQAVSVSDLLTEKPYLAAGEISKITGTPEKNIPLIYKLIQRSDTVQDHMNRSENRDYFNVVRHYFNKRLFTVVFFVGTTCPSRCIYCPNVSTDKKGRRTLREYANKDEPQLTEKHLQTIFSDLADLKNNGSDILVKISGGLEPLTDTKTMFWITKLAGEIKVPVKLFTNGILLNSAQNRSIALETDDIRISLCTSDEDQYQGICFGRENLAGKTKALKSLKQSIQLLCVEREKINHTCKIGFNSIIIPSNLDQITRLIDLAWFLKIDYIDFKPNYFSKYDAETESKIKTAVENGAMYAKTKFSNRLFINFTGSLNKSNLYWNAWNGDCDSIKQSNYKIFITPFGDCSPIHYGAFPHLGLSGRNRLSQYTIGKINDSSGLAEILDNPLNKPRVPLKQLNPFELMLNLEMTREEKDELSGIPLACSPYHTSMSGIVPEILCS